MEDLINTMHQYVEEVEPILQVPPYLVEATTPQRRRSSSRREDVGASGSRSQRRRSSTGPHDLPQHFTTPQSVSASYGAYPVHGVSTSGRQPQHFTTPQSVPTSYGAYPVHDVSTSTYDNENDYVPQPGADMHTPNQQYDAFASWQTSSFMSMLDFDSNAYRRGDLSNVGHRPNYNPSPIPFFSTGEKN
ncbi:hypothetical protein ACS0TY_010092 [Phlomoides rotata]